MIRGGTLNSRARRARRSIISATFEHTCATRADGTLWCWGKNDSGELGIGGDTDQELPRQVTG